MVLPVSGDCVIPYGRQSACGTLPAQGLGNIDEHRLHGSQSCERVLLNIGDLTLT